MSLIRTWSLCALLLCSGAAVAAPLDSRALDAVPFHVLPQTDLDRVRRSLPEPSDRGPVRLAVTVPMSIGLDDGTWTEEGETSIWRTRIYSTGARLLIASFDRFNLPDGGELRFSDVRGSVVQGPYTLQDQSPEGGLWTALVPGDEALIEIRVPRALRASVDLHLASVSHGLRSMDSAEVSPKSGSCNVDVACNAGDGWNEQIRSSVLITAPAGPTSVTLCSGQLVNNSAGNDRVFVLTANHCGITTSNDQGVVAYFNYETRPCGGTPNGSMTQNLTGAVLRASHGRSDHTLIEMEDPVPAGFNAYFSGFDASGTTTRTGRAIHHPQGDGGRIDEKRISVYDSTPTRVDGQQIGTLLDGFVVDAYRVTWTQGVTEGGSSGGGLWNSNRQLIGVLSGGNTSCSNPRGNDFFGRLEVAWAGDARFRQFLDPANTGGAVTGKNAGSTGGGSPGGGGSGGSSNSSGGGGGGSFSAALALLFAGLIRLATARRAGSRHVTD